MTGETTTQGDCAMRNQSLPLHVCAGVTLTLAILVLLNDLYGQLPNCNGTIPGPPQNKCPDGKAVACPTNIDKTTCIQKYPPTVCSIVQPVSTWGCVQPNPANPNVYCYTTTGTCVINYYCSWEQVNGNYTCNCDPSGTFYSYGYTNNIGASKGCIVKKG